MSLATNLSVQDQHYDLQLYQIQAVTKNGSIIVNNVSSVTHLKHGIISLITRNSPKALSLLIVAVSDCWQQSTQQILPLSSNPGLGTCTQKAL